MPRFFLLLFFLPPVFATGQANFVSHLEVYDLFLERRDTVFSTDRHIEAPNWTKDGKSLVVNAEGRLWYYAPGCGDLRPIETDFADKINNDHLLSPDGKYFAISHYDQPGIRHGEHDFRTSRIYRLPVVGGTPRAVTKKTPSFLHGWSPDGQRLTYVGLREENFDVYSIAVTGGPETRLTTDPGLDDGPEYSPDGRYIYYNSMASGKMELWQMDVDGDNKQQLTDDTYSNWFPHPDPSGNYLVFLSYLRDQGDKHPALQDVALRIYNLATGNIRELCRFTGGQGTINVPSWSPDGTKFAFISYEILPSPATATVPTYLYALVDGEMPASAYIDGRLDEGPSPSTDALLTYTMTGERIQEVNRLPLTNSVRRWPNSMSLSADGRYGVVAEQDGRRPANATTLAKLTRGKQLLLLNLRNPSAPKVVDSIMVPFTPAAVAFHPTDSRFILTGLGTDSIYLFGIDDNRLQRIATQSLPGIVESVPAIPHFSWHPSGTFAAVSLAGNDKLQFLRYENTAFLPWGAPLKTPPLPGIGHFTHNGRFFALTVINLTGDVEQTAYGDNQSLLILYRFDATRQRDSPPTRSNDGQSIYRSPPVKHTISQVLPFGSGYVENFTISADDRYLVGLNMAGSWVPGQPSVSSLELFRLNASTGKAQFVDRYPFAGVLPEQISFTPNGTHLAVATFEYPEDHGSLDLWRLWDREERASLVPLRRTPTPRGLHFFLWRSRHQH